MKKDLNKTQKIGRLGEDLSCRYLKDKGFQIIYRNYRKFFGEIDIIATKGTKTYFFEVKTVSRDLSLKSKLLHENYKPEDNLHPWKITKLIKIINYYVLENKIREGEWQLDALTVLLDEQAKKAKIERIENIVL